MTQQIAKDKADSERQIKVQKALTESMVKSAVNMYKKQSETAGLVQKKAEMQKTEKLEQ